VGILSSLAETTAGKQASNVADELRSGDVIGAADDFAGQTDESIGRQFDDTPGGGFADTDTFVNIATGSNTPGTNRDVISVTSDRLGGATGTNPYEENELGAAGDLLGWIVRNPLLVVGAVLLIYLTPLLTTSLGVVENLTE